MGVCHRQCRAAETSQAQRSALLRHSWAQGPWEHRTSPSVPVPQPRSAGVPSRVLSTHTHHTVREGFVPFTALAKGGPTKSSARENLPGSARVNLSLWGVSELGERTKPQACLVGAAWSEHQSREHCTLCWAGKSPFSPQDLVGKRWNTAAKVAMCSEVPL